MATIKTNVQVKFKHFNGTLNEWNQRINNPANPLWDYKDAIVFGKVWSAARTCTFKIYAGRDSKGVDYIYDIPSAGMAENIQETLNEILEMLKTENQAFVSSKMKKAIELYLSDSYDNDPTSILNKIKQSLIWHYEDDLDEMLNNI